MLRRLLLGIFNTNNSRLLSLDEDFSNSEILKRIGYPIEFVPAHLRVQVHGQWQLISPGPLDESLRVELDGFVQTQVGLSKQIEAILGYDIKPSRYSNSDTLQIIKSPTTHIPNKFLDPLSGNIMTYPVILDDSLESEITVDLRDLLALWETNKTKFVSPKTIQPIRTLRFDKKLKEEIKRWVEKEVDKVADPTLSGQALDAQIVDVKIMVHQLSKPETNWDLLQKCHCRPEIAKEMPVEFISANLNGEIMTHPVKIDNTYTVCFLELEKYWRKFPYKNPYEPHEKIRSIVYLETLKVRIDAYVANPTLFYELGKMKDRLSAIKNPAYFLLKNNHSIYETTISPEEFTPENPLISVATANPAPLKCAAILFPPAGPPPATTNATPPSAPAAPAAPSLRVVRQEE